MTTKTIKITMRNHSAWCDHQHLPMIRDALTWSPCDVTWDGQMYQVRVPSESWFRRNANDVCFPAGLVQRVRARILAAGHDVELKDVSRWPCLEVDYSDLIYHAQLGEWHRSFLEQVSEAPRGQIVGVPRREIASYVTLLTRRFSGLHVLVMAKNNKSCRKLAREVRRLLSELATAIDEKPGRLELATVPRLQRSWWEEWDILIFADYEAALSCEVAKWNPLSRPARQIYTFLPTGRSLHDSDQFQLEVLCGPPICDLSDDEPTADVRVLFVDGANLTATHAEAGLAWKRHSIWHNDDRNRRIAEIVRKVRAGDDRPLQRTTKATGRQPAVAILVESTEHGHALLRHLPGYRLMQGKSIESIATWDPRLADKQIGTMTYAVQWGIAADVLIRADGTAGWPLPKGFPPREAAIQMVS